MHAVRDIPTDEEHQPKIDQTLAELEKMYLSREAEGQPLLLLSETQKLVALRWTLELPGGITYTHRMADAGIYTSQEIRVRFEDNPCVMCIGLATESDGVDYWMINIKTAHRGWIVDDRTKYTAEIARAEKVLAETLAKTRVRNWNNRDECAEYLRKLMFNYVPR